MTDAGFEGQDAWVAVAQRLYERSHSFHLAALEFLKKAEGNHLNAAIAVRCSEEGRKLDAALLKTIYPYGNAPELRRRKSPKESSPKLTDDLLKLLFTPEEPSDAPMDAPITMGTIPEDPAMEAVGIQHGCHDSPR